MCNTVHDTTGPSALCVWVGFHLKRSLMTVFEKPFLSTGDQILLLKSRGMAIADEPKAKLCLERIGYYRLSAYWYPFREQLSTRPDPIVRGDNFIPNTTFGEVFNFYVFDKKLRLMTMDALERIEIALRADIANLLAPHDPCAHRKPDLLNGKFNTQRSQNRTLTKYQFWLNKLDRNFKNSREDFAEHFRTKYPNSDPPIWIASEVWDWGMLSHLFSGMKPADKDRIANSFGSVNGRQLESWIRAMNDVRNICAHHSRLWNRGLTVIPRLPASGDISDFDHLPRDNHYLSRLYTVLVIMRILLKRIHPNNSLWHKRIADHVNAATLNPIISTSTAGFPSGWEAEAIWQ